MEVCASASWREVGVADLEVGVPSASEPFVDAMGMGETSKGCV